MTSMTAVNLCLSVLLAANVAATLSAQSATATEEARYELIGLVRGPDRALANNVTVTVRWRLHPELPGLCGHTLGNDGVAVQTATTSDRGRFRISLPVAGPFEVLAGSADGTLVSIRRFPVMAGGFLECELQEAPWIGGVVRDAKNNNAPVADFELQLTPFEQTWARHRGCGSPVTRYTVTTGKDGRWRTTFPSGYLREPFWEPYLVLVSVDPQRTVTGSGLLMPDESCQRLELEVKDSAVTVGQVVGADGQPVAAARVFDPNSPATFVQTDGEGRFRMPSQKPKRLHVAASGFVVGKAAKQRNADGEALIQLARTPARSVVLRDREGQVLGGRPVLWSDQWSYFAPLEHVARTDRNGVAVLGGAGLGETSLGFVLVDGLYVPFVPPPTEQPAELTVQVRAVTGTIVDADGTPVAGARIVARSREDAYADHGHPIWVTYSDHGGRFCFASLPAGPLVLVAAAGEHGFAKAEVAAKATTAKMQTGEEEPFVVEVLDAQEKPCAGVWVTMTSMGGPDADYTAASPSAGATLVGFTGDDGRVSFRGVPEARWLTLGMRLVGTKIEATATVFPDRSQVTRLALAEHKR